MLYYMKYNFVQKGEFRMSSNRGEWGSRTGFILAAVGSAVGLGNIWRFPYMVASNGGGAFMVAYLIAMLTAGIPIMILEFSIGHKMRKSAPLSFRAIDRRWEWLGWFQVIASFCITVYYGAIIGWSLSYAGASIRGLAWGSDTTSYFFNDFLKLSEGPFQLGGIVVGAFIPLVIVWLVVYFVLLGGVKGGIEKANKIFMPLLFIMVLIILFRGLTLPGALKGLDYMFKPDFSKITDAGVWISAYGQVFFSLSIAFAIMITYSSYLPEKSDINNNAFMASFADVGFSLLAGISVFSILGYMANAQGKEVADVATAGVGLAFVVFPQVINTLPGFQGFFGAVFFLVLAFAGFTSIISITEVIVAATQDLLKVSRKIAVTIVCSITFIVAILFTTGAGLYILDIVDHYVNDYNIVLGGLIEILLIGWILKKLPEFKQHANDLSDFKIGIWWDICLKYITPIMLIIMSILKFKTDLTAPYYEGYPLIAQVVFGWSVPILGFILALILSYANRKDNSI